MYLLNYEYIKTLIQLKAYSVQNNGKRTLGRVRRRLEDNIKIDLQEMDWIDLA